MTYIYISLRIQRWIYLLSFGYVASQADRLIYIDATFVEGDFPTIFGWNLGYYPKPNPAHPGAIFMAPPRDQVPHLKLKLGCKPVGQDVWLNMLDSHPNNYHRY